MSRLFNVYLKIGKRSFSTKLYSNSPDNILTFVNNNLQAKVTKISEIVYDVSETVVAHVDDPTTYKNTMYFTVRNDTAKKSAVIPFQTVKLSRTPDEVFADMKLLLKIDALTSITSNLSVSISTI